MMVTRDKKECHSLTRSLINRGVYRTIIYYNYQFIGRNYLFDINRLSHIYIVHRNCIDDRTAVASSL